MTLQHAGRYHTHMRLKKVRGRITTPAMVCAVFILLSSACGTPSGTTNQITPAAVKEGENVSPSQGMIVSPNVSAPAATTTPQINGGAVTPAGAGTAPVPVRGIIVDFTGSNITLDTAIGRVYIQYDNTTAASGYAGANTANSSQFKVGQEIVVFYFPDTGFAREIQFLILPLAVPVTGSIVQVAGNNVMINTPVQPNSFVLSTGSLVINADGSAGSVKGLAAGTNVRLFYYPQFKTVVLIEIL